MKRITLSAAATVAGLLVGPSLASALTAMTTESTNLRAGPAFDFPVVDRIPDDARVTVHGCVRAYRWCDVSWRDARGWVAGNELAYFYQQRYVPVVEYGPRIGLPIVVFSFDTYWDRYYRGRPFYGERTRWRTVWRDRDGGGRREADRSRDRREGRADRQTTDRRQGDVDRRREGKVQSDRRQGEADRRQSDRRREVDRRQGDSSEKGVNRPANRQTDRTESRERSEGRALSPGDSRGPARDGRGRSEGKRERPSAGPQGGRDGGGGPVGERRPN